MVADSVKDCLFCRIAEGSLPATRVYEDEVLLAFPDLHPQAPVHLLLLPKEHVRSTAEAVAEHGEMLGRLVVAAAELARRSGLEKGYRLVINTGSDGGQTVEHLHLHLLGGRPMGWPPG